MIYGAATPDVVIVQVNPLGCDRVPTTATEIMNRVNEIRFNSSLMRAMRAISFVTDLIAAGKLDARMDFLLHLTAIGRQAADGWIDANFDSIGMRSTIDIMEKFL